MKAVTEDARKARVKLRRSIEAAEKKGDRKKVLYLETASPVIGITIPGLPAGIEQTNLNLMMK